MVLRGPPLFWTLVQWGQERGARAEVECNQHRLMPPFDPVQDLEKQVYLSFFGVLHV